MEAADIVTFDPRYREQFRLLNLAWIETHFRVEPKDLEQVSSPEACVEGGGQIFFVIAGGQAIGTCAMYRLSAEVYELAKMAVEPEARGRGYGDLLMEAAERWAAERGAREIHILSNTVLEPAIRLYRKHGYEIFHLGPHPDYERCNIELRKALSSPT